jgi:glycosyltransferase involved in cell wall biosynthesis
MANADIYVQTSKHEGYCLTLAEAKCLHKPIVSTNFVGAFEQLINEYNGIIVECDVEELYKKIKDLINDPLKRNKLAQNLRKINIDSSTEIEKFFSYIERK